MNFAAKTADQQVHLTPAIWDYLIVTASNALQASAYETQLEMRRVLGLLPHVRETLVVPDLDGKRIGSGGSTLYCLMQVLNRRGDLRGLRILIVHAGGDSRRLPAYGPCGKIFVPIPGVGNAVLPPALFDRLVPAFLALPEGPVSRGQVVVAAGDALILFDSESVDFSRPGITALGCYASPEEAARHGVFCIGRQRPPAGEADETVRSTSEEAAVTGVISEQASVRSVAQAVSPAGSVLCTKFLQKPSIAEQIKSGALNGGRSALDAGVMSMDADTAAALLRAFGSSYAGEGIDLYREICCGLGTEATLEHYVQAAQSAGSPWPLEALAIFHAALREIPFHVSMLADCGFLHFGATSELIQSGLALVAADSDILILNSAADAGITGARSWVEGCRIAAPVHLPGWNVLIGADIDEPLALPPDACLDILSAADSRWFIRCYGIRDGFKESVERGALFCNRPLLDWIAAAGVNCEEIWPDGSERTLWNARVFPAESSPRGYRNWLWMYAPELATAAQKAAYLSVQRYSASEIAWLADQAAFHERRLSMWKTGGRQRKTVDDRAS